MTFHFKLQMKTEDCLFTFVSLTNQFGVRNQFGVKNQFGEEHEQAKSLFLFIHK